jgi:argininosuccinate lyase
MSEPGSSAAAPSYVRSPAAAFLRSLPVDRGLVRYDLAGSVAHVEMLRAVGLLTDPEAATLIAGLRRVAGEVASGSFPWREELEDVHTNVEARLTELVGPVGGKLHTGRSRNDQVALDERLYLRDLIAGLAHRLLALNDRLATQAANAVDAPMPGFTHLQRAQPVTLAHWFLAHAWRFDRDLDRLLATAARADVNPLGAGALAGSTLPLDPARVAARLGFDRSFENSLDAVSDRDGFAELLFDLALLATHASGLGEEIVLFATTEFGYLRRTPALGSGSSQMPQKRNPDVAELVRGRTGRAVGELVALLTALKGLPLAYNRDLQEDKGPVLRSVANAAETLDALLTLVPALEFDGAALLEAASDPELYATDRAEALARAGQPFREAHRAVAMAPPRSDEPVDPRAAIARRRTAGGPAAESVHAQLARLAARSAAHAASLSSLDRKVALVEELLTEVPT